MISILLMLAAASPAVPAAPAQARIAGHTSAGAAVARDALNELAGFSARALNCGTLTGVKASVMPKGWLPSDPNFRVGPANTTYERWDAQLCGKAVPFLVGFWRDPKEGPLFQVAHPFPAGKVRKPSR